MNWTSDEVAVWLEARGWIPDPLAPGFYRHENFSFGLYIGVRWLDYNNELALMVSYSAKYRAFKFSVYEFPRMRVDLGSALAKIQAAIEAEHGE